MLRALLFGRQAATTSRRLPTAVAGLALALLTLTFAACSAQPAPGTAGDEAPAGSAEGEPAAAPDDADTASEAGEAGTEQTATLPPGQDSGTGELNPQLIEAARGQDIVTDEELEEMMQPPGGEWLIDDEGRRYYVTTVPKLPGSYRKEGEGKVRVKPGLVFDVVREGEESFDIKIYAPRARQPAVPPTPPAPPQPVAPATSELLRFADFGRGLPDRGQWRQGFAVADMNADGHPDIVHGPPRKGARQPQIFLGDGAGNWRPWEAVRFPDVLFDYGDVAVADFDADGNQDLALAMHLRGVVVMTGDGEGGFELWSEGTGLTTPEAAEGVASFSSRAIEAADWDGDGRTDLVALGEGPRMGRSSGPGGRRDFDPGPRGGVVFLNRGDGSWRLLSREEPTGGVFGDSITVADLDADGHTDFLTASASINRRDLLFLASEDGTWQPRKLDALPPASYVWAVDSADVDADGRTDLLIGYQRRSADAWWSGIDVLFATADGGWEGHTVWRRQDESGVWTVAAGDLDADGSPDLVGVTGRGEVVVLLGRGDGRTFTREAPEVELGVPTCRSYHAAMVDLDGRPGDELILSFAGESGSEVLFPEAVRECPTGGAIKVWKVSPRGAD